MREVPMDKSHMLINLDKVMDYVDGYTIGNVGVIGIIYRGKIKYMDLHIKTISFLQSKPIFVD